MTTTIDFPTSLDEADLQERIPEPTAVRTLLLKNRRERLLLQQLLKLAERIHVAGDSADACHQRGD